MRDFKGSELAAPNITCTAQLKSEILIEIENLEKNAVTVKDLLNRLEEKIYLVSRPILIIKENAVEKDVLPLAPLAMKINEVNQQLYVCNNQILNMIDACRL